MPGRHTSGHTGGGRRGNPQNLVPQFAEVAHALAGIDLPQDKQGLLDFVHSKNPKREVIDIIDNLPEDRFETMADVMAAIGKSGKSGKSGKGGGRGGKTMH